MCYCLVFEKYSLIEFERLCLKKNLQSFNLFGTSVTFCMMMASLTESWHFRPNADKRSLQAQQHDVPPCADHLYKLKAGLLEQRHPPHETVAG